MSSSAGAAQPIKKMLEEYNVGKQGHGPKAHLRDEVPMIEGLESTEFARQTPAIVLQMTEEPARPWTADEEAAQHHVESPQFVLYHSNVYGRFPMRSIADDLKPRVGPWGNGSSKSMR